MKMIGTAFQWTEGEWPIKHKISFPDISVIGWLCFILGKFRLLCE